ncbi:MAG: phosphatidate cytidylyltransferase [Clostridia bacterium]|nr:phosphatidate cytidylyltransferase [Clostridia bacterium]
MKQRVISAAVMIVLLVGCLLISDVSRVLLFMAVTILACHEMKNALAKLDRNVRVWSAYLIVLGAGAAVWIGLNRIGGYVFPAFMIVMLGIFSEMVITQKFTVQDVFATFGVYAYPLAPLMLVMYISIATRPTADGGSVYIWPAIFINSILPCVVSDTFALFGGKAFGKHKLAPAISPKKTVEGLICGLAMGTLSGFLAQLILVKTGLDLIPMWAVIVAAFIASVSGAIGDLAASSVKRAAGIKDYSNLIPGHGGIMDRIDSELFAIPIVYMIYAMFI